MRFISNYRIIGTIQLPFVTGLFLPQSFAYGQAVETIPIRFKGEVHVVSIYNGYREEKEYRANVHVDRPGKEVTLILLAYERTNWKVTTSAKTLLSAVILGGRHPSALRDAPEGVGVFLASAEKSLYNFYLPRVSRNDFNQELDQASVAIFLRALQRIHIKEVASLQAPTELDSSPIVVHELARRAFESQVRQAPWKHGGVCASMREHSFWAPEPAEGVPGAPIRKGSGLSLRYSVNGPDYSSATAFSAAHIVEAGRRVYGHDGKKVLLFRPAEQGSAMTVARQLPLPGKLETEGRISALVYDTRRKSLFVVAEEIVIGAGNKPAQLFSLSVPNHSWSLLGDLSAHDHIAAAYEEVSGSLFLLRADRELRRPVLEQYSIDGKPQRKSKKVLSEIIPADAVPTYSNHPVQLYAGGGCLMLLARTLISASGLPERRRIFLIDPGKGIEQQTWSEFESQPSHRELMDRYIRSDAM